MKRSPLLLRRIAPSPRQPSVSSTPAPARRSGGTARTPCLRSGMPARAAMPRPSPVLMKALVEAAKMRPAPPVASSTVLASQNVQVAGFHFQCGDADHVAVGVADQVQRHPLDEETGLGLDVLLVQRVQHGVTGAVSRSAGALHGLFAVVGGVAAEGALVDRAVGVAVERHAHVFQVVDDLGRFAAHEFDRVLVAQPVGALDGVVEMVVPVVLGHVAQRGTNAALRGHRVRAGGEHLGQHRHVQAGARQLQRRAHAGAAGTDDDDVKLAPGDLVLRISHELQPRESVRLKGATELEWPSPRNRRARQGRRCAGPGAGRSA